MAVKAALVLLLSSAAAYRCQHVVPHRSDARTSAAVIAAERRRRFGAVAALSGIAAVPSTARAITWKVRDRRPLHWTSRGDGVEVFDSKRSILDYIYVPSTRRRRPHAGRSRGRQRRVHGQVPESHSNRVRNCTRNLGLIQGRSRPTSGEVQRRGVSMRARSRNLAAVARRASPPIEPRLSRDQIDCFTVVGASK